MRLLAGHAPSTSAPPSPATISVLKELSWPQGVICELPDIIYHPGGS